MCRNSPELPHISADTFAWTTLCPTITWCYVFKEMTALFEVIYRVVCPLELRLYPYRLDIVYWKTIYQDIINLRYSNMLFCCIIKVN